MDASDTFCVLPWYSKEVTQRRSVACCLLPMGADIDQIKSDLMAGIKTNACKKCWSVEQQGQESRRQLENKFLDYRLDKDIGKIQQDCVENKNSTLLYQIALSNLCNQACVSCSSVASTRWAEIETKMGLQPGASVVTNLNDLNIDYARAQRISLLGGEPLFDPRTYELLQKLLDHGNNQCFISLITNGSIKFKPWQVDLFAAFENKNVCVSIDGIQSRFEYLRWPGRWDVLLENLEDYRKIPGTDLSVSYTISAVNAIYYDETVAWFKQQNLNFNHNVAWQPYWLSLSAMPVVIKQHLQHHEFFKNFCAITGKEMSSQTFLAQLDKQDQAKKIFLADCLPELHQLLTAS